MGASRQRRRRPCRAIASGLRPCRCSGWRCRPCARPSSVTHACLAPNGDHLEFRPDIVGQFKAGRLHSCDSAAAGLQGLRAGLQPARETRSYGASAFNSRSDGLYAAQSPQRPIRANRICCSNSICFVLPIRSRLRIISDFQKLSLTLDPNHLFIPCHPVPREGALAIVTDVGAGSGGREGCD
jgi:hypothetical protein